MVKKVRETILTAPDYILLDHTADLAIMVRGVDLPELFENAGRSLVHIMLGRQLPRKGSPRKISLSAQDLDDLMVRWLGEILYLLEGEHLIVTSVKVSFINPSRINASVRTVPFDSQVNKILCEIKAVTYHQIQVAPKGDHWEARVIMDV